MWNSASDRKQETGARGFTLLEIMVALAILSISLVVLLGLRNRDVALAEHARKITEATILARQRITAVTVTGFPDLGKSDGDFGEDFPKYRWAQEIKQTFFEEIRELILSVRWKEGQRGKKVEFTTYLFDTGAA